MERERYLSGIGRIATEIVHDLLRAGSGYNKIPDNAREGQASGRRGTVKVGDEQGGCSMASAK